MILWAECAAPEGLSPKWTPPSGKLNPSKASAAIGTADVVLFHKSVILHGNPACQYPCLNADNVARLVTHAPRPGSPERPVKVRSESTSATERFAGHSWEPDQMPWTPNDAERHTHNATTWALQELWAQVANECLERTGDEGRAIREANAVIARQAEAGN